MGNNFDGGRDRLRGVRVVKGAEGNDDFMKASKGYKVKESGGRKANGKASRGGPHLEF